MFKYVVAQFEEKWVLGLESLTELGNSTLRHVGVIWFTFHVLQLLSIRFIEQNACCISKSTMKHMQKAYWNSDLPLFGYG